MSKLLSFDELRNIRDLGGAKTADGRTIVSGKLIRCGHLAKLSEEDKKKLSEMIDTVIDFRTDGERKENIDNELPGVSYYHLPIVDSLTAGITREADADINVFTQFLLKPDKAKQYMCDMYVAFAKSEFALSQYAKCYRMLLNNHEKAVLWHCTAGKDRAGMAAAILEELLGVPRDAVISDYLSSNQYLHEDVVAITAMVKKQAGTDSALADESLRYLLGAERAYIEAFYAAADEKYGSFEGLVREGLRLTDKEIEQLKTKYLI